MSDDLLSVRDSIEADMAAHEARHGEVHASRNQSLAATALEEYERTVAAAPPTKPEVAGSAPIVPTVEKREIDGNKYVITRDTETTNKRMFRTASEFESQVLKHALPRLELLMSKKESGPLGSPSWHVRTKAALYFKVKSLEAKAAGQPDLMEYYERAYQLDLEELLESSNQAFGDWRKSPEKKIVVSG